MTSFGKSTVVMQTHTQISTLFEIYYIKKKSKSLSNQSIYTIEVYILEEIYRFPNLVINEGNNESKAPKLNRFWQVTYNMFQYALY